MTSLPLEQARRFLFAVSITGAALAFGCAIAAVALGAPSKPAVTRPSADAARVAVRAWGQGRPEPR